MNPRALPPAVMVALWPTSAHAHLVSTGLGPLYDGVTHMLVSPDDLLAVLALGALSGLNGPEAGRRALFALPLAWLIAGAAGVLMGTGQVATGTPAAVTLLGLGLLTALDRRLSAVLVTAVAVALGLLHGWLNGVALGDTGREGLALVGITGAVFVIAALAAGLVVPLRAAWTRIAVRVAGSWVAAIGLLMLGWSLRS